jgi:hypothetical protein
LLARDLPTSIMLCTPPAKVPPPDERGASPLAALRLLRTTAGDQCRAADIASRVGHSAGVNSARGRSPLCPAAPRNGGKATEAHAEQPEGCWLGHCGVLKTVDASVLGEKVVIRTPQPTAISRSFFPTSAGSGVSRLARMRYGDLRGIALERATKVGGSVMPSKSAIRAQPAGRAAKARPWAGGPEISVACLVVARLDGRERCFRFTPICRPLSGESFMRAAGADAVALGQALALPSLAPAPGRASPRTPASEMGEPFLE